MIRLHDKDKTAVLHPDTGVSTTTGPTVFETLQEKHPELTQPDDGIFSEPLEMNELPYKQQVNITNEIVEKVIRKLHGGDGPGVSNSEQWSDFLLRYRKESNHLRDAVAYLANELSNKEVKWKQIHTLMSCRLLLSINALE